MIRGVRIELVKLGTVRLSYGLLATAVLLTGFFSVVEASRPASASRSRRCPPRPA